MIKSLKTLKITIGVFILLFLLNFNSALSFKEYNITCIINNNDSVNETIDLVIYNNNSDEISELTYIVPYKIKNLKVSSNKGIDKYYVKEYPDSSEITIKLKNPIKKGEVGKIHLSFSCDIVWDKGSKKLLSISVPAIDSNFNMKIALPVGASLVSPSEGLLSVTPQGYTVGTDGKRIYVEWNKKLKSSDKYFYATVSYELSKGTTVPLNNPKPTDNIFYYLLIGVLVLLALGLGYGILYEKKKNKKLLKEINELNDNNNDLNNKINDLKNEINIKNVELKNRESWIKELEKEINRYNDIIGNLKSEKSNIEKELDELKNNYSSVVKSIGEKDKIIKKLTEELDQLKSDYDKVIIENRELINKVKHLNNEIKELNDKKRSLEEELTVKKNIILDLKNRINNYEKEKEDLLMSILTDDEKMVIKLIKEYGSITQKDIVDITGLTKPKISRIVSDLEGRGIIKKIKVGRINKLIISDNYKWSNNNGDSQ